MLGTIVPLVLVLMTITGAVYPAIDLTAGERERGTLPLFAIHIDPSVQQGRQPLGNSQTQSGSAILPGG